MKTALVVTCLVTVALGQSFSLGRKGAGIEGLLTNKYNILLGKSRISSLKQNQIVMGHFTLHPLQSTYWIQIQ